MGRCGLLVCLCSLCSGRCTIEGEAGSEMGSGCGAVEMKVVEGLADEGAKEAMQGG